MECVSAFLHFYLFENFICLCTLGNKLASTPSMCLHVTGFFEIFNG